MGTFANYIIALNHLYITYLTDLILVQSPNRLPDPRPPQLDPEVQDDGVEAPAGAAVEALLPGPANAVP